MATSPSTRYSAFDELFGEEARSALDEVIAEVNKDPRLQKPVSHIKADDIDIEEATRATIASEEYSSLRYAFIKRHALMGRRRDDVLLYCGLAAASLSIVYVIMLSVWAFGVNTLNVIDIFGFRTFTPRFAVAALAFAAGAAAIMVVVSRINNWSNARDQEDEALAKFRPVLKEALMAAAVSAANDKLGEREVRKEVFSLSATETNRLVEMSSSDSIDMQAFYEVHAFVDDHITSAVGVSGPRGVGKTTLIKRMCNVERESRVGVYIASPINYDPKDFVRAIHGEVARAFMSRFSTPAHVTSSGLGQPWLRFALAAVLCAYTGIILLFVINTVGTKYFTGWNIFGALLIASGFCSAYMAIRARSRIGAARRAALNDSTYFRRQLERLEWVESSSDTTSVEVAPSVFTFGREASRSREEREMTHPELVIRFKNFVSEARRRTNLDVVIGLDELDKIERSEDALALINGIKDLMHLDGVHFVVSVSEDALARFALRGLPIRDEFDSTFDAVVPVSFMTLQDAQSLVDRRILAFPPPLTYFCHAVSGGLPRDLIRHVRTCAILPKSQNRTMPAEEVCLFAALQIAKDVITGYQMIQRKERNSQPGTEKRELGPNLRSILRDLELQRTAGKLDQYSTSKGVALISHARDTIAVENTPESAPCSLVLAVLADALSAFGRSFVAAEWTESRMASLCSATASALADARQRASDDPLGGEEVLTEVRRDLSRLTTAI